MPDKAKHFRFFVAAAVVVLAGGCAGRAQQPVTGGVATGKVADKQVARVTAPAEEQQLVRFESMEELSGYLADRAETRARAVPKYSAAAQESAAGPPQAAAESAAPPSKAPGSPAADESITNTQEQGVDEGGIVKTHGNHLVVLRRGRLFTVHLGHGDSGGHRSMRGLRPIDALPVNPEPGHEAWYDEMLIRGDTIVVVGYCYQASATEIGLFTIDGAGQLNHRDTFFLRSNDYYSSRNYASRLLEDRLVFYMPYSLPTRLDPRHPDLPGVMPWSRGRRMLNDWETIIDATEIYRPIQETDEPVLHTVVMCDLGGRRVRCDATGIIGPRGRSFYVSRHAVYVWVHGGEGAASAEGTDPPAAVYRFPLAGGNPGALRVWGAPVDQFSFKESSDGYLNVLVMASSAGEAMWGAEFAGEDVALMRAPTAAMARGVRVVNRSAYVDLPEPTGAGQAFQNRFVGDTLLYGRGSGWGGPQEGGASVKLHSVPRQRTTQVRLPHGVDRIEPMGDAAVVVGTDGRDLHFTSLDLRGGGRVAGEFVQPYAAQGELRSHGFFFLPDGPGDGKLGLPIRRGNAPGYEHLREGSAEVLFLEVQDLRFHPLGSLASSPRASQDDRCQVSCVDWYGNARPIFYRSRIFALLGYELVEGRLDRAGIREWDRVNMMDLITRPSGVVWKEL